MTQQPKIKVVKRQGLPLDSARSELSLLRILIERNYDRAKEMVASIGSEKKEKPRA